MEIRRTSAIRVALAFLAGATLGAGWITFGYIQGMIEVNGFSYFQEWGFKNGTSVFLVSFVFWLAALASIAGPIWALARWRGWLNWHHALIAGFLIPFFVSLATSTRLFTGRSAGNFSYYASGGRIWEDGVLTAFGWKLAWIESLEFALLSAVITLVCWFVAYARKRPDQSTASAH